jgi:hypothetical protein
MNERRDSLVSTAGSETYIIESSSSAKRLPLLKLMASINIFKRQSSFSRSRKREREEGEDDSCESHCVEVGLVGVGW